MGKQILLSQPNGFLSVIFATDGYLFPSVLSFCLRASTLYYFIYPFTLLHSFYILHLSSIFFFTLVSFIYSLHLPSQINLHTNWGR